MYIIQLTDTEENVLYFKCCLLTENWDLVCNQKEATEYREFETAQTVLILLKKMLGDVNDCYTQIAILHQEYVLFKSFDFKAN
jgi:hypothetical protein